MPKSKVSPITILVLGKEYQVASPESEHPQLIAAARFLDQRMKEIRESGKVLGLERIAVMAALNISYELLNSSATDNQEASDVSGRIERLSQKIDSALQESDQLELTNDT